MAKHSTKGYIYNATPVAKGLDHQRTESRKTVRLGGLGVFSEAMSPENGTSYTIKEYQSTRLANHVPNEDNRHASMDKGKLIRP